MLPDDVDNGLIKALDGDSWVGELGSRGSWYCC